MFRDVVLMNILPYLLVCTLLHLMLFRMFRLDSYDKGKIIFKNIEIKDLTVEEL